VFGAGAGAGSGDDPGDRPADDVAHAGGAGTDVGGPGDRPADGAAAGAIPPEVEALAAHATSAGGRGPVSLLLLGVVLLFVGGGIRWAQDVTAPWLNLGEADLPGPITFEAEDATYRIITSGPTRPSLEQTTCTITKADGTEVRERGTEGVDGGQERFGVTRVMEFDAVAGPTSVTCSFSFSSTGSGSGRMQIVRADGPITLATTLLLVGGVAALVVSIGWFVRRITASSTG
jgi:hypothetical protein